MQYRSYRQYSIEPFFQDDWKVNKKLTLNLGIRYSLFTNLSMTQSTGSYAFEPNLYNPAVEAPLNSAGVLVPNPATGQIYDPNVAGNGIVRCGTQGFSLACTNGTHKNIGPRFGFAYDPTGSGKTVVRGGYGIFYEIGSFNESMAGLPLWTTGPSTLAPVLDNLSGYSAVTPVSPTTIQTEPTGTSSPGTIPTVWNFPAVQNFSLGVQHDFGGNNLLTVSYVGSLGRHLATQRNINQVPLGATTMTVPGLAGTNITGCTSAGVCNVQQVLINAEEPNIFFVPYEGYGTITMQQDTAVSNYNSLQVEFRHTFSKGLTLQSAYTWSHSLDNSSDYSYQSGIDDSNLYRWYATSGFNRAQIWVTNFVYDLPFFRHSSNAFAREALGGWSLSDITSFFSGPPMSIYCGINGMSSGIGEGIMCNSLGRLGVSKHVIDDPQFGPTPGWFNPGALEQPTVAQLASNGEPGMFGYNGRNILQGPGRNNWDVALLKNFEVLWFSGEHSTVQFRLETFNTFNHPQWQGINASCSGATLPGQPCNGASNIGNGEVSSAWSPRILQLALKLIF
jgi:TonB dependent receptor